MKRYQVLLQERADLIREQAAIFDRAEREGNALSDEDKRRDDEIAARLEALSDDIRREERRREAERLVDPIADANMRRVDEAAGRDGRAGFRDLADFGRAVLQASRPGGMIDERLRFGAAPTGFHQETGTAEGYMVPPEFRQEIWRLVYNNEDLLGMVKPEPTQSNAVELLADETTPWGSTGILAYWRAEGSQMTTSKLGTKLRQVRLFELYAFVTASDELLQDAPRLNNRLTVGAAQAIRWKCSEAIMNGTGSGQAQGWMTSPALLTQAAEGGQAAGTIVPANVAKMYARCLQPGQGIWFVNQDTLPQLFTMTLGNYPIYMPPQSGFQNAPGGMLLGRPIHISEHCKSIGTSGDIQFVNLDGYYATTRDAGPQFASSIHLYFDYGLDAFRWTFRFGGEPFLSAPMSPANGSNTKSHFVALAAR